MMRYANVLLIFATILSVSAYSRNKGRKGTCPWMCTCSIDDGVVDCSHQELNRIPKDIPKWTRKLILTGNFIYTIPYGSLQHLRDLEELHLDHNYISRLTAGMVQRLVNLRHLNLARNRLSKLTKSPFRRLKHLEVLSLHYNKMHKIDVNLFKGLEKLKQLDISNNELQTLEVDMFKHMKLLTHLYVVGNKWHCDCQLKKFEMFVRSNELRYGFVICDSPGTFSGQNLQDVQNPRMCGPDTNVLIAGSFGAMLGVMVIVFTISMCRKRAALNAVLEINGSGQPKNIKVHKDSSSRSSVISVLSMEANEVKKLHVVQEKVDLESCPEYVSDCVENNLEIYEEPLLSP